MTEELKKIPEDKLIFVDIETARLNKELDEDSEEFSVFSWKVRNRDTDKELPPDEVKEIYKKKAALYSSHSKIICITCGFVHEGKRIILKTFSGEEKDILRDFVDTISSGSGITMVFWNMYFDVPTIRKRFFINKLKDYLPNHLGNDSMKKPWTIKGLLDLMDVYKGISYKNESMNEVAWAMGLPLPKADMKGSDVSEYFYNGKINDIIRYNQGDVKTLINLYRIFTDKDVIENITVRGDAVVDNTNESFLEKLYNSRGLTENLKEDFLKLIEGKKLTKKDKKNIEKILTGVLIRKDFVNQDQDTKKVIEQKESQVKELLKNI